MKATGCLSTRVEELLSTNFVLGGSHLPGLFARVSPLKAAAFVRARLAAGHSFLNGNRHEWDFPKTVRALVDDAVHCKTCTDNVSVVCLRFSEREGG